MQNCITEHFNNIQYLQLLRNGSRINEIADLGDVLKDINDDDHISTLTNATIVLEYNHWQILFKMQKQKMSSVSGMKCVLYCPSNRLRNTSGALAQGQEAGKMNVGRDAIV